MGFITEFKEFISKSNVLDLAVGVIIGAAFSKIVTSLTEDILMPILGLVTGGIDFRNWFLALNGQSYKTIEEAKAAGVATINYGLFLNAVFYFIIIAFCVFLLVKAANRIKLRPLAAPTVEPGPTKEQVLLAEIRDVLRDASTRK